ncbi:unnamed protein product [Effrenium voratum]|uniref:Glutamate racemase n=1 Tax=Effrenium voratum TaxID=2562239 RepID=A0AA36MV24_9DINO|nr:unnamed protein product [Effrenium voratum]
MSAMALAILLLRAAAAVPWEDLDLGRPEKMHGGPHLRNGGGAGLASCEAPAEPETVLRHAWAKVVDEMLTSEEGSDEIANTARRQYKKLRWMSAGPQGVGVFDSGVGGLTVYRKLRERFPLVDVTYLADSQRAPYGPQPPKDVADYSREIITLLQNRTRLTLIACNTASVAAIAFHVPGEEAFHQHPVLPIAAPYGSFFRVLGGSGCRRVGLFATDATCRSGAYQRQVLSAPGFHLVANSKPSDFPLQANTTDCIGCAECVAAVQREGPFSLPDTWAAQTEAMLRKKFVDYLDQDGKPKIDYLIFGCTHFPTLEPLIRKIFGPSVLLVDPADYQVELASRFHLHNSSGSAVFTVSGVELSEKLSSFRQAATVIFQSFLQMANGIWQVISFV